MFMQSKHICSENCSHKKKIGIVGSTGSIGKNACHLLKNNQIYDVEFLICNNNFNEIIIQIKEFSPKAVYVSSEITKKVKSIFPSIKLYDDIKNLLKNHQTDVTLYAISGISGIKYIIDAIENTRILAIANKEAIVSAWNFVQKISIENGTQIIPVDSEHNSLYRLLEIIPSNNVSKIGITASGGQFFGKKFQELKDVSTKEALLHPNWQMGIKNTIDSSTMANKVLEIIEAMQLFSYDESNILVSLHRQSIVHANIWLKNGGVVSFSSKPDMKSHISYAIFEQYEEESYNIFTNTNLEFYEIKKDEFPIYFVGRDVAKTANPSIFTIFNVANEIAVEKFIKNEIKYTDILTIIEKSLAKFSFMEAQSIEELLENIENIKNNSVF